MLTELIYRQLRACEVRAASIRERLPFADGPAFYQDRDRIRALDSEAAGWRQILRIVEGATNANGANN